MPETGTFSRTARLIVGSDSHQSRAQSTTLVSADKTRTTFNPRSTEVITARVVRSLWVPAFLRQLAPQMLGGVIVDALTISTTFFGIQILTDEVLPVSAYVLYLSVLFPALMAEGVYGKRADLSKCNPLIIKAAAGTTALLLTIEQLSGVEELLPIAAWSVANLTVFTSWRWLWHRIAADCAASPQLNTLVIGDQGLCEGVINAVNSSEALGYSIKEFLPESIFRTAEGAVALSRLARQEHIDNVIVATHDLRLAESVIRASVRNSLDVHFVPDLPKARALAVGDLNGLPLATIRKYSAPEWELAVKRMVDVVAGLSFGLVALPLLGAMAAVIKVDSRGPVFYRGRRIGRKGRPFTCYKLRTMRIGSDATKNQLRQINQREGAFFKIVADPRLTRVGPWLRRFSLDELPQLWNVIVGDMSLVGPRPHPIDDVERYRLEDFQRLDFTPGITGLWQVTARQDPSFERCVALDVYYIRNWTLKLDLQILWKTVAVVFQGSGA